MQFTLSITLGNDAMQNAGDIADALCGVADRIQRIDGNMGTVVIRDRNGNQVGEAKLVQDEAFDFDGIDDDVYELATRISEKRHGVGLTGLWEDGHHDEVAEIVQEVTADLTGNW